MFFGSRASLALMLLASVMLAGCRGRAYSDLYLENMAAEIRDLEDQLYEYDHEYLSLEQEYESLRAENAALKSRQSAESSSNGRTPLSNQSRSSPVKPAPALPRNTSPPRSILENESGGSPPASSQPSDSLPSPQLDNSDSAPFDGELVPPTIVPGVQLPPGLPTLLRSGDQASLPPESDLELSLSRIEIPGKLVASSTPALGGKAKITPAVEQVTDTRVVELAFHPSMSRAANFDEESDDDGVYLVLLPKNERGQMVPVAADLSVLILDLARERDVAEIGRWDYSAAEVRAKLEPIGANQGIHLSLPWNGPDPIADKVLVFVRYTFKDGRTVIGEKTFVVSGDNGLKTVWVPRVSPEVSTASFESSPPRNVVRPQSSGSNSPAPSPR